MNKNLLSLSAFTNKSFQDLLLSIKDIITREEYQSGTKTSNKNMLRICLQSLGSPVWMATEDGDDNACSQDLIKFMYCLRVILRDTNAVAYITMPTHLFDVSSCVDLIKNTVSKCHNTFFFISYYCFLFAGCQSIEKAHVFSGQCCEAGIFCRIKQRD